MKFLIGPFYEVLHEKWWVPKYVVKGKVFASFDFWQELTPLCHEHAIKPDYFHPQQHFEKAAKKKTKGGGGLRWCQNVGLEVRKGLWTSCGKQDRYIL